jgi:hypothetical protein
MAFRSFSTRGSYSTVQAKVFAQLIRGDAGVRVGKALLRRAKIVRGFFIMLHNEIPHVIGQGHTSRQRGGGELRLYLLRHVEFYRHTLQNTGELPRLQMRFEGAKRAILKTYPL